MDGRETHRLEQTGALLMRRRQIEHSLHRLALGDPGGDAILTVVVLHGGQPDLSVGTVAHRGQLGKELVRQPRGDRRTGWAGHGQPGPGREIADAIGRRDGCLEQIVGSACLTANHDDRDQSDQ